MKKEKIMYKKLVMCSVIFFNLINLEAKSSFYDQLSKEERIAYNKKDYPSLLGQLTKKCNSNNYKACDNLGSLLYINQGYHNSLKPFVKNMNKDEILNFIKQNSLKAKSYYTKACDGGYTKGCTSLGLLLSRHKNDGITKDYKKAMNLFSKACEKKDWSACTCLGECYELGKGVKENIKKANELYNQACDNGDDRGCSQKTLLKSKALLMGIQF